MRTEADLGEGVALALETIVDGQPQAVSQVLQRAVHRETVEHDRVTQLEVTGDPLESVEPFVEPGPAIAGTQRRLELGDAGAVRAPQHAQATELDGAVPEGNPAGVEVGGALVVRKVLVRWCRPFVVRREAQSRDRKWVRECRLSEQGRHATSHARVMRDGVERLEALDVVVDLEEERFLLDPWLDGRNGVHRIGTGLEPSVRVASGDDALADLAEHVDVDDAPKEHIPVAIEAIAQRGRVVEERRGVDELVHGLLPAPRSPSPRLTARIVRRPPPIAATRSERSKSARINPRRTARRDRSSRAGRARAAAPRPDRRPRGSQAQQRDRRARAASRP